MIDIVDSIRKDTMTLIIESEKTFYLAGNKLITLSGELEEFYIERGVYRRGHDVPLEGGEQGSAYVTFGPWRKDFKNVDHEAGIYSIVRAVFRIKHFVDAKSRVREPELVAIIQDNGGVIKLIPNHSVPFNRRPF